MYIGNQIRQHPDPQPQHNVKLNKIGQYGKSNSSDQGGGGLVRQILRGLEEFMEFKFGGPGWGDLVRQILGGLGGPVSLGSLESPGSLGSPGCVRSNYMFVMTYRM